MERQADIAANGKHTRLYIFIILLFHLVGLVGLIIPASRPLMLQTVPFHLLLMFVVLIASHQPKSLNFFSFTILIFLCGYFVEWVGVHKGWLFGNYSYGKTLGLKIDGIPLLIGINWFMLIYAMGVTLNRFSIKNPILRSFIGAAILVVLDLLIEPVAIRLGYWHWQTASIPLKNYICWFLLSGVFIYVFDLFQFKNRSIVPVIFLITQFVFFALLNIFGGL